MKKQKPYKNKKKKSQKEKDAMFKKVTEEFNALPDTKFLKDPLGNTTVFNPHKSRLINAVKSEKPDVKKIEETIINPDIITNYKIKSCYLYGKIYGRTIHFVAVMDFIAVTKSTDRLPVSFGNMQIEIKGDPAVDDYAAIILNLETLVNKYMDVTLDSFDILYRKFN